MKPRNATTLARISIGALAGSIVLFLIGCPVGCVVGYRVAYHENDGAAEVLFRLNPPISADSSFWFVHYDEHDRPTLEFAPGPTAQLTLGQRATPSSETEASTGPWTDIGPTAYFVSTIPAGDHAYQGGGVGFGREFDVITARLIVYPQNPRNGWVREYYTYEVRGDDIRLIRSKRERSGNDWGIEEMSVYTLMITIGSCVFGAVLGAGLGAIQPWQNRQPR